MIFFQFYRHYLLWARLCMTPPNSYAKAITPVLYVTVFGDEAIK